MREVSPSYHKEVMGSKHKFIVVRAARRTGKTRIVVQWAASKQGNTLLLVPNQSSVELIQDQLMRELGDTVERNIKGFLETSDGRRYYIVPANRGDETIRGMRADNVVVDEFGLIDKQWMQLISYMKANSDGDVLMIGSSAPRGSLGEAIEEIDPYIHRINYTWKNASDEEMFNKQDLENLIGAFSSERFMDEFGPWMGYWGQVSNDDFIHLLNK